MATLTDYELQRQARIQENQRRMQEFGLLQTVQEIAAAQVQQRQAARQARQASKAARAARRAAGDLPAGRVRRSERVAGIEAPNYNENARLLSLADNVGGAGNRIRCSLRENISEEIYGIEHLDALGSYQQEWTLFVDGYDASGNRVYDKVNGQTCHQCRQKTLGKRTACSGCGSLQGVLCGDCLFMRYGENVDEVNANRDWLCPLCRDICNCSFHRSKRGWAPTGTLYRHAIAEGYKSCAHFLVLNNLSDKAKPVALERGMCPPELAAQLKKEIAEAKAAGKEKEQGKQAAEEEEEQAPAGPAAAVDDQLVVLEAEPAAPAPRRSARGSAVAAAAVPAASKPQKAAAPAKPAAAAAGKKRQATIPVVAAAGGRKRQAIISVAAEAPAKKVKGSGGGAAAAGKGTKGAAAAAAPAPRRGLRVRQQVSAAH